MKTYVLAFLLLSVIFLVLFGLVTALGPEWLTDPMPWLRQSGLIGAAAIGIGLLVVDVALPVPSSLVMLAHGALFGVLIGTAVSALGSTLAAAVGYWFGRRGEALVARRISVQERQRVEALFDHWGDFAIVLTRPVPILAECVAILSGTTQISWPRFLIAAGIGSIPAAFLLALAGSSASRSPETATVLGLAVALAGVVWLVRKLVRGEPPKNDSG